MCGSILVAALLAVPFAGLESLLTARAAGAAVTNFSDPSISFPDGITAGPDGALWFTNYGNDSIGRVTTSGAVTNFTDPGISHPDGIVVGPDGALWFANLTNNSIGRITTSGAVTDFTDPSISYPYAIAVGPDGALWFTNYDGNSIGRITTSGAVTNFTDPTISTPSSITTGPDGALWFTNYGNDSIGRITTAGAVTNFTDPGISSPNTITSGPDGALWFTSPGNLSIGRITTAGVVTHFTDAGMNYPYGITAGPDGALWFTNYGNYTIGRISTAGEITNFSGAGISNPTNITTGADGALWFANNTNESIGRITTPPVSCGTSCVVVVAAPGAPAASSAGPPTPAHPTKQVITLPNTPGARFLSVRLQSIDPGPNLSAADKLLCPAATPCSGQISVIGGNFAKYVNQAHPIQIQIIARWNAKVPPGKLLMLQDSGGPPIQLAKCVLIKGAYNTPCANPELVKGTAAANDLTTTDTILFVGTDPRFARHVDKGPDAPTAVSAHAGKKSATVTWRAPVVTNGRILGYQVAAHLGRVTEPSVAFSGTALKGTITGLISGKSYTFTVKAKTAAGISLASKASNVVRVT